MDEGISSPQGLVGKAFEDWLTQKYGGEGAFRVDGLISMAVRGTAGGRQSLGDTG